jgi:hypothetical protein
LTKKNDQYQTHFTLQLSNVVRQLFGPFGLNTSKNGFEIKDVTHFIPVLPHVVAHVTTPLASPENPWYPDIAEVKLRFDKPDRPDVL